MNKKILITGFEAFGNNLTNPTQEVLALLANKNIDTLLLPVSFEKAFITLQDYLKNNSIYTHIIHLGLASDRDYISIEKVAINFRNANIPDNDDNRPTAQKIIKNNTFPDGIFSNISMDDFLECSKTLNGYVSYHAGTYVCNDLFYKSLVNYPELKIAFIHVPNEEKLSLVKLEDFLISFIQKI